MTRAGEADDPPIVPVAAEQRFPQPAIFSDELAGSEAAVSLRVFDSCGGMTAMELISLRNRCGMRVSREFGARRV